MLKRLGKEPKGKRKERIQQAENYRNGKFHNVETTSVNPDNIPFPRILWKFVRRPNNAIPSMELPHVKTDLKSLKGDKPVIVWFGHSSYLINCSGYTILIDPVFSGNASPF